MSSETVFDGATGLLKATDSIAKRLFGDGSGTPMGGVSGNTSSGGGYLSGKNMTFTVNGVSFEMVYVQGGSFTMGCTTEQGSDCRSEEKPPHRVSLTDFYIGKYEVTQLLWRAVMGDNPSMFKGDNLPVENVSWDDCQTFISRLNSATGKQFRLPTEAQWEYAARGGAKSRGFKYSGGNDPYDVYKDNSGERTHEVGGKQPNELGIFDMTGNVWEWCRDWYGENYYGSSPVEAPTGASSGSYRVLRGGSWISTASRCRVAYRSYNTPGYRGSGIGLRLLVLP
jgi:formylglycine-generating enzyme required for sulfatase activity